MTAEPTQPDLHAAIMNLPCKLPLSLTADAALAFKLGHRDARHAAAELASAAAVQVPVAREGWREAIARLRSGLGAGSRSMSNTDFELEHGGALLDAVAEALETLEASAPPPPEGAPVAQIDPLDAELNRILTMPEEQLDAEIRAEGGDPDDYARRGKAAFDRALETVRAREAAGPVAFKAVHQGTGSWSVLVPDTAAWDALPYGSKLYTLAATAAGAPVAQALRETTDALVQLEALAARLIGPEATYYELTQARAAIAAARAALSHQPPQQPSEPSALPSWRERWLRAGLPDGSKP